MLSVLKGIPAILDICFSHDDWGHYDGLASPTTRWHQYIYYWYTSRIAVHRLIFKLHWNYSIDSILTFPYSAADMWNDCGFDDKSMKFGTLLEYTFLVIFGYRAIADLTCDKIGSHFPIWPPSSLGNRGFVWENCGTYLFSVDFDPLWGPY